MDHGRTRNDHMHVDCLASATSQSNHHPEQINEKEKQTQTFFINAYNLTAALIFTLLHGNSKG